MHGDCFDSLSYDAHNKSKFYIPTLRGLRPLSEQEDLLSERTHKDYGINKDSIISGFTFYNEIKNKLLGQPAGRKEIKEYETALQKHFFNGKEITLIPEVGADTISILIDGAPQIPIQNLGDGLQSIILLTYKAFLTDKPCMFFIEEPETSLHPGLLRRLIQFFLEQKNDHQPFNNHQYFITTHSHHILDFCETNEEDVTIYKARKISEESDSKVVHTLTLTECTQDRELLLELGVHPSSVYLANCTIWVEGITDRLYIQQYIKKYIEENKKYNPKLSKYIENHHYAFIEYQGSTLAHWDFSGSEEEGERLLSHKLSSPALIIADGDIKGPIEKLITNTPDNGQLYKLKGKEIENTIGEEVLHKTIEELLPKKKIKKPNSSPQTQTKEEQEIQKEKIKNIRHKNYHKEKTGIGFIIDQALEIPEGSRLFKAEQGETINGKVTFCKTAVKIMQNLTEWQLTEDQMGFLLTFAINSLMAEGLVTIQEENPEQLDLLDQLTEGLTEQ